MIRNPEANDPASLTRRDFLSTATAVGVGTVANFGCASRSPRDLDRLRGALRGAVILPGEKTYDQLRRVASFNPRTDQHPAVIVRCANSDDVARALEYARARGLEVAVRGGGHDVLGRSTSEGGVLIDLGPMNGIAVDPERRLVRVDAGVRAGQLTEALHEHGLAAVLGCNPAPGVAGLTLGGGLGWWLGRFGAACDNLAAVDLVTVDSRPLRVTEEQYSDLFWGLRGGGGNFGVATAFELRVHPVDTVVGGYLVYPGDRAAAFLRLYRDFMASAPDELAVEVIVFASSVPPHQPVVVAIACYSGDVSNAERTLGPLRTFGPSLDLIRESPYARFTDPPAELASIMGIGAGPQENSAPSGGMNYWRGASLTNWTDQAIDAFVGRAATAPRGWSLGLGHYMHGQICRTGDTETPLVRRERSTSYYFNIGWGGPDRSAAAMDWVDGSIDAMLPFSDAATYVNYLSAESESAVEAAYGPNYVRLQELKRRYDPDNVFHLNRNILPAS